MRARISSRDTFADTQPSAKRAARLGDGYLGNGDMTPFVPVYHEELQRLGKTGQGKLAGGHFWLIVSNEPDKTFDRVAPHIIYQLEMYNVWLKAAGQQAFPAASNKEELKASGMISVVTPTQAIDEIAAYIDATGIERYYTWTVPPGLPAAAMNPHLALFASDVMPAFKD